MRYIIALITLALGLAACGQQPGPIDFYSAQDNPSLTICDVNDVEVMRVHGTNGSATIKVTEVFYRDQGLAFATPVEYEVNEGMIVQVPFCKYQGVGDIVFLVDVTLNTNVATLHFEAPGEHVDVSIWDAYEFETFSSWSTGVEMSGQVGEKDRLWIAFEWWTY